MFDIMYNRQESIHLIFLHVRNGKVQPHIIKYTNLHFPFYYLGDRNLSSRKMFVILDECCKKFLESGIHTYSVYRVRRRRRYLPRPYSR